MSAGLPNITGILTNGIGASQDAGIALFVDVSASGALRFSNAFYQYFPADNKWSAGKPQYPQEFNFDASRCSSIYGNANTVQPPSLTVIYAIKY